MLGTALALYAAISHGLSVSRVVQLSSLPCVLLYLSSYPPSFLQNLPCAFRPGPLGSSLTPQPRDRIHHMLAALVGSGARPQPWSGGHDILWTNFLASVVDLWGLKLIPETFIPVV